MRVISYPGGAEMDATISLESDPDVGRSLKITIPDARAAFTLVPSLKEMRQIREWFNPTISVEFAHDD